ncbi:hypothetical protein CC78DRAFT_83259 [Lojkania enalia]|uniref:Uncharacterized protein n=1 Tax=Lojkania enalia TaxID=147567 RepID=A0A9P4JZD9_9PLEO|nr:hypothetical protein CC78DRAFT_83259 [Didymosphaeria enalia]
MQACARHDERSAKCLRPNTEQSLRVLSKSRRYWKELLDSAMSTINYPASCFRIHGLLNQTPALPSHPGIREDAGNSLCLEGSPEWDIGRPSGCSLESTTKASRLQKVPIGLLEPTFCQLSKVHLPARADGHDTDTSTNYLAIFVLGWSYIFSARLVELRGESFADQVIYTELRATVRVQTDEAQNNYWSFQMGDLTATELRWWEAILASGCGWQAVLCRSGRRYYPSWSCHLDREEHFEIILSAEALDPPACRPPTSKEAQQYLSAFARANNAYDQLLIALAASLTLPPQGRFGAPIVLPHPRAIYHRCVKSMSVQQSVNTSHIPHYIALSSIPHILSSSMFGCFWEPGLECHLASEWINPAQSLVQSIKEAERPQIVVKMMALHRPSSAPLWIGAATTGLIPTLLRVVDKHLPPISLEATIWTSSMQSFMDPQYYRVPPKKTDSEGRTCIPREDEFRLLYVTDVDSRRYPSPPLSPWPPFGTVELKDTALEVQQHLECAHRPLYKQWNWQLEHGLTLHDPGIIPVVNSIPLKGNSLAGQLLSQLIQLWKSQRSSRRAEHNDICSETLSRSATRCVFQWSLSDGVRPEDKALWEDEWLKDLLEDGSESEASGDEVISRTVE